MASIQKRGGKYQVRWVTTDGVHRSKTCPDQRTAKALAREIEGEAAFGRDWKPAQPSTPLTPYALAEAYLIERRAEVRRHTLRNDANALQQFIKWCDHLGITRAETITRDTIQSWVEHLALMERSPNTIGMYLTLVQNALRWGVEVADEKGWNLRVLRRIRLPRAGDDMVSAPSWGQMAALVNRLQGWHQRAALIQHATGARISEALLLEWGDLDTDAQLVTWRGAILKGGYGGRRVPVPGWFVDAVKAWPRINATLVGARGLDSRNPASEAYCRAWEALKVPEAIWQQHSTHALRKGVFTNVRAVVVDPDAVDYFIGHKLTGQRSRYTDVSVLNLVACAKAIPSPLSEPPQEP